MNKMVEILKIKTYNYIQELKIVLILKRNLIIYDKNFKNKLLSLININEIPNDYIYFIKSNYLNFKPYMLKKEDLMLLNEVIKPDFNYVDYCLGFNEMDYNLFYNKVKYIALILGYEQKSNKESSNYNYKDSNVPNNIIDAIKNVE